VSNKQAALSTPDDALPGIAAAKLKVCVKSCADSGSQIHSDLYESVMLHSTSGVIQGKICIAVR
jgi:hypothetical protein